MMELTISDLLMIIQRDKVIGPYSQSLYTAILTCWRQQGFPKGCRISRSLLMPLSDIRSNATYHKCLNDLVQRGYIGYEPSYHKWLASTVTLPETEPLKTKGQQGGER